MHTDSGPAREMVMIEELPRECRRAIGVVAFDSQCVCRRG
jgi:hypothetical protein